jgi:hypothetical protein
VFEAASLPLVSVPASTSCSQAESGALFKAALSRMPQEQAHVAVEEDGSALESSVPSRPKCGEPLVVREARQGKRRGVRFYGCVNIPSRIRFHGQI